MPRWPDSTRAISELRLSFRTRPSGWFAGMRGPQTLHLDIVDYPGEWLLDLCLMEKTYADWAEDALARIASAAKEAAGFLAEARAADASRRWTSPRRRRWPAASPPICKLRARPGSLTARRGGSCCRATLPAARS
ncbi:hypothetical protein MASR1M65_04650 [Saprospiraceae bacterium]